MKHIYSKYLKLILRMSTFFKNYYAKDVAITRLIIVLVSIYFKLSQSLEKDTKQPGGLNKHLFLIPIITLLK